MKAILLICLIITVCALIYYNIKKKRKSNIISHVKKQDMSIIKSNANSNKEIAIKVEQLPIEAIANYDSKHEIKDNKILSQVNSLVPELVQVGTTASNAIQANSQVLYQAIIPAGTTLTKSSNIENAFRGLYHGTKGIKGHADLVAVNQQKTAIANTVSSGIGVTSMIVGQYYMTQINGELDKINNELSKISSFQDNEYKSKILSIIIQIKRISTFETEILENKQLRDLDIDKLNVLEQTCTELLGQANCTIKEYTQKNDLNYKEYSTELNSIHTWHNYQKTLLKLLYKITELKNILYLGAMSEEQMSVVLNDYIKQTMEVHNILVSWHEETMKRLEIDIESSRIKRKGIDGAIHWIPGLFKEDFNFSTISENTKLMIEQQSSEYDLKNKYVKEDIFNKDIKLISKDGKVYYLPE